MIINLHENTVKLAVDAAIVQNSWSMNSIETRSRICERLTHQVWEHVCALIAKELKNRKYITYDPVWTQQSQSRNKWSDKR